MHLSISDVDVALKPVIYRVDYNEPVKDGVVLSDFRIRATLPTLDYLLKNKAKVIILSHFGRPMGRFDPKYSLRPIAQHLMSFFDKTQIQISDGIFGDQILQSLRSMKPGSIFFLGNTRFFPQEENNDFEFAMSISKMGEIYVSDAFGASHRKHATTTQLPKIMESYPGMLMQKEVAALDRLRNNPSRPFTAIIGGAKLKTKLSLLKSLLPKVDYILAGGAMANLLAKSMGRNIGESFTDDSLLEIAKEMIEKSEGKIILPVDFMNEGRGEKFRYVDIGNKTVELFKQYIAGSKEIFWNGTMGIAEEARFANGTRAISDALINAKGATTVAGGDTVSYIEQNNIIDKFDFVSTGGGAAVAYIAGEKLPGIDALKTWDTTTTA